MTFGRKNIDRVILHIIWKIIQSAFLNCVFWGKIVAKGHVISQKNPPLDFHSMSSKIIQSSQNQTQGIKTIFYREKHDLLDMFVLFINCFKNKFCFGYKIVAW